MIFRTRDLLTGNALSRGGQMLLLTLLIAKCPAAVSAQEASAYSPADTSSPRATLTSFIDACNEFHRLVEAERYFDRRSPDHRSVVRRVIDCLDVSQLPGFADDEIAGEAAVAIKEILDRIALPPEEEIPDLAAIAAAGGPDKLTRWHVPGSRLTIARVEVGVQKEEYLFSPGTVARSAEYYDEIQSLAYRTTGPEVSPGLYEWFINAPGDPFVAAIVDRLPQWTRRETLGMVRWKWIGLLSTLLIAVGLMAVAYSTQLRFAGRWRETALLRYCLTILLPVAAMLVPIAFRHVAQHDLTIRGTALYAVSFSANLVALLASLVVVVGTSGRIAELIIASPRINPHGLNAQFIRILSRMLGILASVIVLLEGAQYLGIPISTLLASAGVGGLALALAAQHTLKGLFGTMMLMADKPFRVGDRIQVLHYDGFVETIGLRSTRIRLFSGHLVTLPNDQLADHDIENIGSRPHIRRVANIHIPLDTPQKKLEQAADIVRDLLADHEGMDPEFPPRVHFNEFNAGSFNLQFICWYTPPAYWKWLDFCHRANLDICRAFEDQGISFSLPDRVVHTSLEGKQKPLDVKVVKD